MNTNTANEYRDLPLAALTESATNPRRVRKPATKLLSAFIRKSDEGIVGRLMVETVILLSARAQADNGKTLRAAAQVYGVDADAVVLKVKQEFAAKEKERKNTKPVSKPTAKAKRAA
jgi:ParB family transcriptional regulator, chromosome partitioning protein